MTTCDRDIIIALLIGICFGYILAALVIYKTTQHEEDQL